MAGFFSKKQYAAIADKAFAMKLLKERCLECSICAMFFNSLLTISINARFLSRILSAILIREFLMQFFTFVTSCIPLRKRFSNNICPIYPLATRNFPLYISKNPPCFKGSRLSTFLRVNIKLRISPLLLVIRCNLNPKNHPMEHLPRSARFSKVLWISMRWLRQTRNVVESTKLVPVQVPSRTFLMKMVRGSSTSFSNSKKPVIRHTLGKQVSQMFVHILLIVMFKTSETTGMGQDENNQNFCIAHTIGFVVILATLTFNHNFFLLQCKFFAEIICHTINLRNFSL